MPFTLLLSLFLVLCIPAAAQTADTGPDAATAEQTPTADAETDTSESPIYPAVLEDPAIPLDELRRRLVPLTVAELTTHAGVWQSNARDATRAVVENSLELRQAGADATEAQ